jgi:hypothetical protein
LKWIKGILLGLLIILLLIAGTLAYLLQASGKVSDFQAWQPKTSTSVHGLTVKFFGVSTLLLDDGHDQILIDGFFAGRRYGKCLADLFKVTGYSLNNWCNAMN